MWRANLLWLVFFWWKSSLTCFQPALLILINEKQQQRFVFLWLCTSWVRSFLTSSKAKAPSWTVEMESIMHVLVLSYPPWILSSCEPFANSDLVVTNQALPPSRKYLMPCLIQKANTIYNYNQSKRFWTYVQLLKKRLWSNIRLSIGPPSCLSWKWK